jgi:SAM-dependent methyltransferase
MNTAICRRTTKVQFWDGYARWYRLWAEHNTYHDPIIGLLKEVVEPGWKVLDIGAGNGALSLPLAAMGCEVTALEPSCAMRSLLFEEAFRKDIDNVEVDDRRWEDVPLFEFMNYNLVIACNTLHLTGMGFAGALEKIFAADPACVLIATEHVPGEVVRFAYPSHTVARAKTCETDSSFGYHSLQEVLEHHRYKKGRDLGRDEEFAIIDRITVENGHLWIKESARVGMYWLHRRLQPCDYSMQ